jgi:uncharacterized protein (UPF0333 family)
MLIKLRKKSAQSTLEYAVLAVVVIAALLSIQNYLKRGIQGKIKSSTDDISAEQYDTENTIYNKTTITASNVRDTTSWDGSRTEMIDPEVTTTNMSSNTTD